MLHRKRRLKQAAGTTGPVPRFCITAVPALGEMSKIGRSVRQRSPVRLRDGGGYFRGVGRGPPTGYSLVKEKNHESGACAPLAPGRRAGWGPRLRAVVLGQPGRGREDGRE